MEVLILDFTYVYQYVRRFFTVDPNVFFCFSKTEKCFSLLRWNNFNWETICVQIFLCASKSFCVHNMYTDTSVHTIFQALFKVNLSTYWGPNTELWMMVISISQYNKEGFLCAKSVVFRIFFLAVSIYPNWVPHLSTQCFQLTLNWMISQLFSVIGR